MWLLHSDGFLCGFAFACFAYRCMHLCRQHVNGVCLQTDKVITNVGVFWVYIMCFSLADIHFILFERWASCYGHAVVLVVKSVLFIMKLYFCLGICFQDGIKCSTGISYLINDTLHPELNCELKTLLSVIIHYYMDFTLLEQLVKLCHFAHGRKCALTILVLLKAAVP